MRAVERAEDDRHLRIELASGDALDVRHFAVEERMSALFEVRLVVLASSAALDFDAIVGQPARFSLEAGALTRAWSGIVNRFEQVGVEESGLSTYELTLVPAAWLLSQRRNHRMFQQITEPDIALALFAEWGIVVEPRLDRATYKKRKYRVQYGESDHAFASRMLEDAGISYFFEESAGEMKLLLSDAPQAAARREGALTYVDKPRPGMAPVEFVTALRVGQQVRPGKYTMQDRDYRLPPNYPLASSAAVKGRSVEERLERYHYTPGAFLFGTDKGEATPVADDKGRARSDEGEAAILTQKRLDAKRGSAKNCSFSTNAHDLAPGMVIAITGHPHPILGPGKTLLVVGSKLAGSSYGEWTHEVTARSTEIPYRPALEAPKPKVSGVESATVVGPAGEEIHVDEFGRVRVHFHWDRESRMDDDSSCWIPVSQAWGGAGYGGVNLPRVGQEVLVDFLGGDPDRPVVVGRVFTNLQKVPYKLPDNKTQSGLRSNSTGGTGGYNEIMFEDAAGRELMNVQAERDLKKLVKNDEEVTIGRDRTKMVGREDSLTVGANRTKSVGGSERCTIGANQRVAVGVNRSTQVGRIDSTIVGEVHTVMVMPPGEQEPGDCTHITCTGETVTIETPDGSRVILGQENIGIELHTPDGSSITMADFSRGVGNITLRGGDGAWVEIVGASIRAENALGTHVQLNDSNISVNAPGDIAIAAGGNVNITGATINLN